MCLNPEVPQVIESVRFCRAAPVIHRIRQRDAMQLLFFLGVERIAKSTIARSLNPTLPVTGSKLKTFPLKSVRDCDVGATVALP